MKYTFEIMKEYEDAFRGISVYSVSEDKKLMVDFVALEELEDAQKEIDEAYQRGLDDAWECARELYLNDACKDLFGEYFNTFIKNHTAQEAIEKLKAHKQDDKIEVGDEVKHDRGWVAVVTQIDGSGLSCVDKSGAVASYSDTSKFRKTGRHFEIEKILEEMKE